MKKTALLLAAVLLFQAFLLTACSQEQQASSSQPQTADSAPASSQTQSQAAAPSDKKVTITYLSRYTNAENPTDKFYMDRLAKFMEENPNITVEDLSITELDAFNAKLKASIAAGDPVNMFAGYGYATELDYAKNGVTKDLSELVNSSDWTGPVGDMLDPWDYSSYGQDGVYGIPTGFATILMFVNKAIFSRLDLQIPETFEDLMEIIPVLKENDVIPIALGAKTKGRVAHFHTVMSLKMFGIEFRDQLVSGDLKWNDPKSMEVFDKYKEFVDAGMFGSDAISYDFNGHLALFENGEAAMMFDMNSIFARCRDMAIADDIDIMEVPYFKDKPEFKNNWMATPVSGYSLTVDKSKGEQYDAAVKLITYMTSKESFVEYDKVASAGVYPVDIGLDPVQMDRLSAKNVEMFRNRKDFSNEFDVYFEMPSTQDVFRNEIQTIFVGRSTKEIADSIQSELDKYAEKNASR